MNALMPFFRLLRSLKWYEFSPVFVSISVVGMLISNGIPWLIPANRPLLAVTIFSASTGFMLVGSKLFSLYASSYSGVVPGFQRRLIPGFLVAGALLSASTGAIYWHQETTLNPILVWAIGMAAWTTMSALQATMGTGPGLVVLLGGVCGVRFVDDFARVGTQYPLPAAVFVVTLGVFNTWKLFRPATAREVRERVARAGRGAESGRNRRKSVEVAPILPSQRRGGSHSGRIVAAIAAWAFDRTLSQFHIDRMFARAIDARWASPTVRIATASVVVMVKQVLVMAAYSVALSTAMAYWLAYATPNPLTAWSAFTVAVGGLVSPDHVKYTPGPLSLWFILSLSISTTAWTWAPVRTSAGPLASRQAAIDAARAGVAASAALWFLVLLGISWAASSSVPFGQVFVSLMGLLGLLPISHALRYTNRRTTGLGFSHVTLWGSMAVMTLWILLPIGVRAMAQRWWPAGGEAVFWIALVSVTHAAFWWWIGSHLRRVDLPVRRAIPLVIV